MCSLYLNRVECEREMGQYVCVLLGNIGISLSIYGNTGYVFAKCATNHANIPLLGAKPSVHIR